MLFTMKAIFKVLAEFEQSSISVKSLQNPILFWIIFVAWGIDSVAKSELREERHPN